MNDTEKYGRCCPYACQIDIDCPNWMTCESGICSYQKCTDQNVCKPGMRCAAGFCFLESCFNTYHCPPNHECINGKCAASKKVCNDVSQCDNPSQMMCHEGRCKDRNCTGENRDYCPLTSECRGSKKYSVCTDPCEKCQVIDETKISVMANCF